MAGQDSFYDFQLADAITEGLNSNVGDDLIDLSVMKKGCCPIAVKNAINIIKKGSVFITDSPGGSGAFRDAIEWIIHQQGRTEQVLKIMENRVLSS